ncbi:surfeit locus protein 4-like [Platysternon megacephalum]|uniref:Surfeit locus protein 4-like n=1 Tax=Platysternon megacephalum TaxID=55544 RepID=A0A4D9E3C2_9SAUR|nr:surfeit locus protein 4-like [Platysternon megacephalum]
MSTDWTMRLSISVGSGTECIQEDGMFGMCSISCSSFPSPPPAIAGCCCAHAPLPQAPFHGLARQACPTPCLLTTTPPNHGILGSHPHHPPIRPALAKGTEHVKCKQEWSQWVFTTGNPHGSAVE